MRMTPSMNTDYFSTCQILLCIILYIPADKGIWSFVKHFTNIEVILSLHVFLLSFDDLYPNY